MIYSRLKLARNLLKDDGVIFISIDDNEQENLKKYAMKFLVKIIFCTCSLAKKYAATNDAKGFSNMHDHILVYRKSNLFNRNLLPRTEEQNKPYKNDDGDGRGLWRSDNLLVKSFSQTAVYPIVNPNTGKEYFPPQGSSWRANKVTMQQWLNENRIYFGKDGTGAPQLKRYLNEVQDGRVPTTWWTFEECGHNDAANKELRTLFEIKPPFDTPKPTKLLKQIIQVSTDKNDIVLDFFAGSSTTADALMQFNAQDGGNRKFIMVQLPEDIDEKSEAYNLGYKNIAEISKERIRRAGKKILEDNAHKENMENLDIGFRVLKIDSTNMKDVYYTPEAYKQVDILDLADHIKEDRTSEDLLFQVMLDWGLELSLAIERKTIQGKEVFMWQVIA